MRHGHHGRIMIMSKPTTFYLILTSSIGFQTTASHPGNGEQNDRFTLNFQVTVKKDPTSSGLEFIKKFIQLYLRAEFERLSRELSNEC